MPEVVEMGLSTGAKALYLFVVDGVKGTGGCPLVRGFPPRVEYIARCRELVALMRRSADLLEAEIVRAETAEKESSEKETGR